MGNQRKNHQNLPNNKNSAVFDSQAEPYIPDLPTINEEQEETAQTPQENTAVKKNEKKGFHKILKTTGTVLLVFGIIAFMWDITKTPTVNDSDAAQKAIETQISDILPVGTILMSSDETLEAKDYDIVHSYSEDETKIWVWDYAAEDGDYVQVLVNGSPAGDPFMIKNKPQELSIPSVGTVQIKGVRDGGGGITYAVRYDLNGTNYFNTAPEGEFNTYTLIRN